MEAIDNYLQDVQFDVEQAHLDSVNYLIEECVNAGKLEAWLVDHSEETAQRKLQESRLANHRRQIYLMKDSLVLFFHFNLPKEKSSK